MRASIKNGGIMMTVNKNNKYLEELNGMLTETVVIKDADGIEHVGILKGFYMPDLNLIVVTKNSTILLRDWTSMTKTVKEKISITDEKKS